jgi:Fe-S cluster assembly ATP-binding protein
MVEKSILEVQNLTLTIGEKRILDDLSLQFWPGYVHAVVGPNGAGKTALASTIMGLSGYTDFEGDIVFKGESLKGMTIDQRARRGLTLTLQEPARYEGLRVESFLRAGNGAHPDDKIGWALEQVGLEPSAYLQRAVDETLSGGERKRIEVASILMMEPKLVILDEPDSGIDVDALTKIFSVIEYLKQQGTTVLMITHSSTVLERADHAFLICCGKLVEKGVAAEIMTYFGERCGPCDTKNQPGLEISNEQR